MKLTFLWQSSDFVERDWIREVFGSIAGQQMYDGHHTLVLDNCLLIDSRPHLQHASYYEKFRGKHAWLLHLSDETYAGGYQVYSNFRGVFRNYWSGAFSPRRVFHVPLGYSEGIPLDLAQAGMRPRKYVWSFLGQGNKSSRPDMLGAFRRLSPNFILLTDRPGNRNFTRAEYREVLLDSTFVPCPMGNVNLESFRVYEALECGSIPIVEKRAQLDYFGRLLGKHPIPAFSSWAAAARFASTVLNDPERLRSLRDRCFDWWVGYKKVLQERVAQFILDSGSGAGEPSMRMFQTAPGRGSLELMLHQSPRTFARRLHLQFGRLFGGRS